MPHTYKDTYSIFETPLILAKAFAAEFKKITDEFISANENINIALSGGNTPKLLYSVLAEEYPDNILSKVNFTGRMKDAFRLKAAKAITEKRTEYYFVK
jgi:hypothetical protein